MFVNGACGIFLVSFLGSGKGWRTGILLDCGRVWRAICGMCGYSPQSVMYEYTVFGTAYLYGIRYEELLMTAHPPTIMNYQSSSAKRDGIDRMCPGS
jgi:hypothetical protein